VFRNWSAALPPVADPVPVVLPGRATRLRERPITRIRELAASLVEGVRGLLDRPFVLFGHSLGALIAFEVARELRRRKALQPGHLFVSSRWGPRLREPGPDIHLLSDGIFVTEVQRRYDAIPDAVLREPELMALLLPALRADFEMLETYEYLAEDPLDCPITAIAGHEDPRVSLGELQAWGMETRGRLQTHRFPGGHFYFREVDAPLLELVRTTLEGGAAAPRVN
jgi:medium-chain acyl-[acyl-carrier-protein] hydrolase